MKNLYAYVIQLITHPIDCCYFVKKERDNLKYIYGIICLLVAAACKILSVYATAYPVNSNLPEETNLVLLLGILILPGISWIIGAYSTTTLMGGESSFLELFTLGCMCYVPYILVTPIQIIVSHVVSGEDATLYNVIGVFAIIWVVVLEFLCFMQANGYQLGKAICVAIVSVIVALLMWAFVLLSMVFIYQVIIFVSEIILEVRSQMIV